MRVFFILNESTRNIMPSAEFPSFFSLRFFFFFFLSFLIVSVRVCVCLFLVYIYYIQVHLKLLAIIRTKHTIIYKIQMYKWLGFNTESLACIRFTSWKIKNNLFTVICMYCVCVWCVCTFSLFYHLHLMFIVCYMWAWWQWYEVAGEAGRPWWPIFAS